MFKIHLSVALQTFRSFPSFSSSFRQLSLSSQILAEKVGKVELPKKPRTPWINFFVKNHPVFKKSYPTLTSPELMSKISKEWAIVPDKSKSKMKELYRKEKEVYMAEMTEVPQEQLKASKSVKSAKRGLKKLLTAHDKPKRPLSSYLLYSEERRPSLSTTLSPSEKVKLMAEEWRQASKQTKAVYENKYIKLVAKYKEDLDQWSMKMDEEGVNKEISMAKKRLVKATKV